ncbi:hypothetical protein DFH06DRAFT_1476976 [Mycena polygramma]|nr:hypothetical protein DFH06DRAFT_1476976 [Mycena polygramma]
MGQEWKIANLDKRQSFAKGWLSEILFDQNSWHYTKSLENYLRPRAIASDLDAVIPRLKPGELFTEAYEDEPALYFPRTATPSLDATAMLVNIPAELAHEIFSYLADFCDLLCLSMSCQVLWEIGREHMYRHIAAVVADHSWVDGRIICVGEFLQNEDIPGIFTPAEKVEFFRYATLEEYRRETDDTSIPNTATPSEIAELLRTNERELWYYPFRRNHARQTMFDQAALLMPCFSRFVHARRFRSNLQLFMNLFEDREFAPRPPAVVRVLRNLSRRQYVRESALTELTAKYPKIGLGEVVLSRICLSSDVDVRNLTYDGGIHRGVWAGDRFDIVAAKWLEELGDDPSWTDVSEEVLEEMGSICAVDYF